MKPETRRSIRTRHAYDHSASRYHRKFSTLVAYRRQILGFVDRLPAGAEVLDLGCGSGANARLMVDAGLRVTGYDYSAAMLELARRECPQGDFRLGNLLELKEERQFDALVAAFCIVHFDAAEARAFLRRLPALMRPVSWLYVSFMEGREAGWAPSSFSDEPLYYNYFDRRWVQEVLSSAGLSLVATSTHDYAESDGSTTTEVFLSLAKRPAAVRARTTC